MSSALESSIWEQITGMPSVSTMSLMQEAIDMDTEIVMLTKANWEEEKNYLELSAETMADIESRINSGKAVIVPVTEQTIGDWTGSGYMVLDMETYVGEYMISGGLNGGTVSFDVRLAMIVNVIITLVEFGQTVSLMELSLITFASGGLLMGSALFVMATVMYVWVEAEANTIKALWDAYVAGDEQAGEMLKVNLCFNILGEVLGAVLSHLAGKMVKFYVSKAVTRLMADEVLEEGIETAVGKWKNPYKGLNAAKLLNSSGIGKQGLKKAVTELGEDELIRLGKLQQKGLGEKYLQELIDNPSLLAKYTDDEILGNADVIFKSSYGETIILSDKKMYQLGDHFEKHGREMGYLGKKEYEIGAREFFVVNKNSAIIYEGTFNSQHGQMVGTRQIIIQADGKSLIILKETGQLVDFYNGTGLDSFINIERFQ